MTKGITIAGAGIAGLACGITLARAGRAVEIWERHPEAGYRFNNGFQILENYQTSTDALFWLEDTGFTLDFFYRPRKSIRFYDSRTIGSDLTSRAVFGYFIKRGTGQDSLDSALVRQAESLGVKFHWNSRLDPRKADIDATGCRGTAGISREMVFKTNLPDLQRVILDNFLTPLGFSYFFVIEGIGTVGAAVLRDFSRINHYFDKVINTFQKIRKFDIKNPAYSTSKVGFSLASTAKRGSHLRVGEAAGFQDCLFGLAIRRIMLSGYLAARSIIEGTDYDALWKKEFKGLMKASIVNRYFFEKGGNLGYRLFIKAAKKRDFRTFGYRIHQNTIERRIIFPLITKLLWRKPQKCPHGPSCIWCRPVMNPKSSGNPDLLHINNHSFSLDEAYKYCRNLTKEADTNFALGFRFLPNKKRRAIYTLYAFNRFADDYVDEITDKKKGEKLITQWKEKLDACYAGAEDSHPILQAFSDTIHRYNIPKDPFKNAIDGFLMDLTINRYQSFTDLLCYCNRVAGTISDMSLAVFGYVRDEAQRLGYHLSIALQLTNIIRDVGKDIEKNRIYIPLEEIDHFNYSEEELKKKIINNSFRSLMRFQIGRAKSYFGEANKLVDYVEPDARLTILLIGAVYVQILEKIEKLDYDIFNNSVSLTRLEKLNILIKKMVDQKFI